LEYILIDIQGRPHRKSVSHLASGVNRNRIIRGRATLHKGGQPIARAKPDARLPPARPGRAARIKSPRGTGRTAEFAMSAALPAPGPPALASGTSFVKERGPRDAPFGLGNGGLARRRR
jgi:hypothetical protein